MKTLGPVAATRWLVLAAECLGISLLSCTPAVRSQRPVPVPVKEPRAQDWPMFRHDVERSGQAAGAQVGGTPRVRWQLSPFNLTRYGAVKGSPAVVDGIVYCGTDTGRFLALGSADGQIKWQVQIPGTTHGIHGSPAVAGDLVYIGAYNGNLYAFNRVSGQLVWQHQLGYQIGSSPVVVAQWGMLFTANEEASGSGYILGLDARTGARQWVHKTPAHPHSSVAVDPDKGLVFVGDNLGIVHALKGKSGEEIWEVELDRAGGKTDVKTTPTVIPEHNLVVFGAWSGKIYALSEDRGRVVWTYAAGGKLMSSTAYSARDQAVFAGAPGGQLVAVSVHDGSRLWSFRAAAGIYSSPAVSGDGKAVVFGGYDGNLYAVRADAGAELWRLYIGGRVTGSPALVGDEIYVTSQRGGLTALTTTAPTP